jgi:hypothetical protein
MQLITALKATAVLFAGLVIVGFSPLVDSDSGWKNTLGDVIWTGIFVSAAALVALAIATGVTRARRGRAPSARRS